MSWKNYLNGENELEIPKKRPLKSRVVGALAGLTFLTIISTSAPNSSAPNNNTLEELIETYAPELNGDALEFAAYRNRSPESLQGLRLASDTSMYHLPACSAEGRYLRTKRFAPIIEKLEETYRIPRGRLAGLIMQESCGNTMMLNSGNDGGAGLAQFQPGTARWLGMNVYGTSNKTGADFAHGKELRQLVEEHGHDLAILSYLDERFDPAVSLEKSAELLSWLRGRFGNWDRAMSAYNQGYPAPTPSETKHVQGVNRWANYYNTKMAQEQAERENSAFDIKNFYDRNREIHLNPPRVRIVLEESNNASYSHN